MSVHELALQRNKYKHLSDDEWRWFLQQVEGRERTADKLPTFAAIDDWWYPVRLSCEQCSSELTARYKAQLSKCENAEKGKCLDLTAGYGVDTYFLSEHFALTDYVEQNEELCRIATHNFANKSIAIHHTAAEEFLQTAGQYDLIYADPARRDSHGGKVFRLEDCTPNMVDLLPSLFQHLTPCGQMMIKLSPMLDISQALKELSLVSWNVHVVAVKNEVKEVLLISTKGQSALHECTITAIDLAEPEKAFVFTRDEEKDSPSGIADLLLVTGYYLYEPNAAILKAGAYKLVAQRFGLHKLDVNTHLYVSDTFIPDFPGRIWRIQKYENEKTGTYKNANIICRNYPLTPEQLKKKMRVRDGGETYLIACRVAQKPTIFVAERV